MLPRWTANAWQKHFAVKGKKKLHLWELFFKNGKSLVQYTGLECWEVAGGRRQ